MSDCWSNASLIQDDLLFNIIRVLEDDTFVGPSFLHALAVLADAVVLHDTNYFSAGWDSTAEGGDGLEAMVNDSGFVQDLVSAELIRRMPANKILDEQLAERGSSYSAIDFVVDQKWAHYSFSFPDLTQEQHHCSRLAHILRNYAGVFRSKRLVDHEDQPIETDAQGLVEIGMPIENIILLEGHNFVANAYVQLSRHLQLSPYMVQVAIPHQIGAIERNNNPPRPLPLDPNAENAILASMLEPRLEPVAKSTFWRSLPSEIIVKRLLTELKGDFQALPTELAKLRDEFNGLRALIAKHESERAEGYSAEERRDLRQAFEYIWSQHFTGHPDLRLTYELRDAVDGPKDGGEYAPVDEDSKIRGQDRTIGAWWRIFVGGQSAFELQQLLASFGKRIAPAEAWRAAAELGREIDGYCRS